MNTSTTTVEASPAPATVLRGTFVPGPGLRERLVLEQLRLQHQRHEAKALLIVSKGGLATASDEGLSTLHALAEEAAMDRASSGVPAVIQAYGRDLDNLLALPDEELAAEIEGLSMMSAYRMAEVLAARVA